VLHRIGRAHRVRDLRQPTIRISGEHRSLTPWCYDSRGSSTVPLDGSAIAIAICYGYGIAIRIICELQQRGAGKTVERLQMPTFATENVDFSSVDRGHQEI
jgi:hypothetical protein